MATVIIINGGSSATKAAIRHLAMNYAMMNIEIAERSQRSTTLTITAPKFIYESVRIFEPISYGPRIKCGKGKFKKWSK